MRAVHDRAGSRHASRMDTKRPCAGVMAADARPAGMLLHLPTRRSRMPLDHKTIEILEGVSTATLTTVLRKKGLRNV